MPGPLLLRRSALHNTSTFLKIFQIPPLSRGSNQNLLSPPHPSFKKEGVQTMFNHHVLCSDELNHDKNTIFFYNSYIINDLKSKRLIFHIVHYSSDGPSSQFKNQYNFTSLLLHQRDHGISVDWNFFMTSHMKKENDSASGNVKNAVWRKVLQNKTVVGDL